MINILLYLIINFTIQFNSPEAQPDHLYFFHNKYLESHTINDSHEVYGKVEYYEMLQAFRNKGFTVHSEIRPQNTDPVLYAQKIKKQIDSLLLQGLPPDHITVVGTSKGGYIAQYLSTFIANHEINYVFVASVMKEDEKEFPEINFCGNILNIYDLSDTSFVDATKRKMTSALKINKYKDLAINEGLSHGFVYKALDAWITPACQWGKRNYDLKN